MELSNETYYQNLLRQYITGDISDADRFILEKKALSDPFLMDALEGINSNRDKAQNALSKLEKQVEEKSTGSKIISLTFYKYGIAASFLILLSVGLWWTNSNFQGEAVLASKEMSDKSEDLSDESLDQQEIILESSEEETVLQPAVENNQYDSPKAVISIEEMALESNDDVKESAITNADLAIEGEAEQNKIVVQETIDASTTPSAIEIEPLSRSTGANRSAQSEQQNDGLTDIKQRKRLQNSKAESSAKLKAVTGQIKDQHGNVLSAVAVYDKSESESVSTNDSGTFIINVLQESKVLNVDKIGFETIEYVIKDVDSQDIRLLPITVHADELVMSQGDDDFPNLHYSNPMDGIKVAPKMGGQLFQSYIKNNIKIPDNSFTDYESIEVSIQFTIDSAGIPHDFKVIQTGGFVFDNEALRLLSNGGKWVTYPPNTEVIITYPVVFSKN